MDTPLKTRTETVTLSPGQDATLAELTLDDVLSLVGEFAILSEVLSEDKSPVEILRDPRSRVAINRMLAYCLHTSEENVKAMGIMDLIKCVKAFLKVNPDIRGLRSHFLEIKQLIVDGAESPEAT